MDLVTFTEEILNGKLHFLQSAIKTVRVIDTPECATSQICET